MHDLDIPPLSAGYIARRLGKSLNDNPYDNAVLRRRWRDGWLECDCIEFIGSHPYNNVRFLNAAKKGNVKRVIRPKHKNRDQSGQTTKTSRSHRLRDQA